MFPSKPSFLNLMTLGIDAYYSFSKRVSEDFVQDSDTVIKRVVFRHCGFIKATLPRD